MKKLLCTAFLGAMALPFCHAQANIDRLFSLDLGYSLTGFTHSGWGVGIHYEHKLLDFFSLKGGIGHMTFLTGQDDVYCTSVNMSLFANYYPLGSGLDKAYIGVGCSGDFMNYFGKGALPDTPEDTLISIIPIVGWKWRVLKPLILDVSVGYKAVLQDAENYGSIKDYVNAGWQFGLGFKILFAEMKRKA
jgi:hypothetical protein